MMEQVRLLYSLAHGELAWHFQTHIQGWMNDLNMLLSCFREKMPVIDATRQKDADGRRERRRGGTTTAEAFGSLPTLVWFPLVAVVVVVALLRSVARSFSVWRNMFVSVSCLCSE